MVLVTVAFLCLCSSLLHVSSLLCSLFFSRCPASSASFFVLRSWPFSVASSVSLRRNRGTKVCSGFSWFLFPVFLQFLSVSCVLYFLPLVAPLSPLFCFPGSVIPCLWFFRFLLSCSSPFSPLFFFPAVPSFSFLQSPLRGCLYPGFYRAERSIGAATAGSNGVGRSIQWRNVPAFNGGATAEEENERTVACPKRLRFPLSKAAFSLVLEILVILQSSPWLKCNWILAFPRHFQASPWSLSFAIWTPIKPQALIFLQLSPWFH